MFTEAQFREAEYETLILAKAGKVAPPVLWRDSGHFDPERSKGLAKDAPLIFVASEESPDRMGDVITASGWSLDNFKSNPVFMLAHDHLGLPIGTVPEVRVDGKQLLAGVTFDTSDQQAMAVKGKYERGVMKAVSVGFRALEFEERQAENGRPGLLFKQTELLEISAVAIPAHPQALLRRSVFYSFPEKVKQEPKPAQFSAVEVERARQAIREIAK